MSSHPVAELPATWVGTLAADNRGGTIQALAAEPAVLTDPLLPGQGVAALIRHPTLPVAYGITMHPEGRLISWQTAGDDFDLVADLPSFGTIPCHLATDPRGEFLVITNYASGSLAVFALDTDGHPGTPCWLQSLSGSGPDETRQDRSHPHHVSFCGDDLLLVTDLGGDAVLSFRLDRASGRLDPLHTSPMPAGSGPRHLVQLDDDQVAISGELDNTVILGTLERGSGTVTVTAVSPSSWRTDIGHRSDGSLASDIVTDGTVVYVANRGYGTVAAVRAGAGTLTPIEEYACGGDWPQHLALSDQSLLIACQRSDQVTVWDRAADGQLSFATSVGVPRPAWLTPAHG